MNLGRRLTLLLMLALHATTSLYGPGHHAVDGLIERIVGVGCSASDCETPGDSLRAESDCAVCDYFSSTPLPVEQLPAATIEAVRPSLLRVETVEVIQPPFAVSIPRAPPSAAS